MYAELRELERAQQVPHSYTTARTLLSILRLSQALARLRFESTVEQVSPDPPAALAFWCRMCLTYLEAQAAAVLAAQAMHAHQAGCHLLKHTWLLLALPAVVGCPPPASRGGQQTSIRPKHDVWGKFLMKV